MSLRLIKPGMRSVDLTGKRHPKTGELLVPLGYLKNGTAVWPVMGASSDDPDDPKYTGQGEEDDDADDDEDDEDEEDEEDEDDKKSSSKKSKKSVKKDDDEDEDDEDDSRIHKVSLQAKRYRLALRAKEKEFEALKTRLQALEDEGTPADEIANRTISDLRKNNETLTENARVMTAQLAFFKSNTVPWIDPTDAFALAERAGLFDDIVDDDGTVDERELRRALKDLAKRKPHLVKRTEDDPKARGRKSKDDDEDEKDDDDEQGSRQSARTMNGRRRGTRNTADRAALAKKFPILQQF